MRQLTKLSALSLITLSLNAIAADKNCLIIVVGGAKDWITLAPGIPTDISIDVDAAARKEARRTGCRVITGQNQDEAEFKAMLKRASKPPYSRPGTTVHMTFTDHGTPQPGNGKGGMYIGKGVSIQNQDFSKLLTENFPKGSRMTFSTNICWGSMTEMVTAFNLDSHFDICGSTSTHPNEYSWNVKKIYKDGNGIIGPYTAVALSHTADLMEQSQNAPSVAAFHMNGKRGDFGNFARLPGFLSSTTFARSVLKANGKQPDVDNFPLDVFFGEKLKLDGHQDRFSAIGKVKLKAEILKATNEVCATNPHDDNLEKFLSQFSELYKRLKDVVPDDLPGPYKMQAMRSSRWLENNKVKLANLITNYLSAKNDFWTKNKTRSLDPKQSEALKNEWEAIKQAHLRSLKDHLFHIRNMQEARTVRDFFKVAKPHEKERFAKFIACERKPVL